MKKYTPDAKGNSNTYGEEQRSSRPLPQGSAKPNTTHKPNPNFVPPASKKTGK